MLITQSRGSDVETHHQQQAVDFLHALNFYLCTCYCAETKSSLEKLDSSFMGCLKDWVWSAAASVALPPLHTRSETIGNLFINLLILLHKLGCLLFEYLSYCTANQSSVNSLSNLVYIPPVKLRLEIRSSRGFVVSPGGPSLSSLFFTCVCLAFYEVFFTFLSSVLP